MVSNNRRVPSSVSGSFRTTSRRPELRKVRVKVHAEDVRYIMVGVAIEFTDLVELVREKFGLRRRFKVKVKDEDMPDGDMITMGDQDDLDMVMMSTKAMARKNRQDIGKMEVCYILSTYLLQLTLTQYCRFGFTRSRHIPRRSFAYSTYRIYIYYFTT